MRRRSRLGLIAAVLALGCQRVAVTESESETGEDECHPEQCGGLPDNCLTSVEWK